MTSPEAGGDSDANSDESEEVYSWGSSIDVQRKHYTDAQHTNYKEVQHTSYTDVQRTHYTDVHTLNTERNIEHTRLAVAAALAAVLMLLQAIGSWVSGSVAVLYDSGHLLCDSCGLLAVLAASKTAQKLPSQRFTFGYLRAEVLGCLATLQLMWVVTAMLVYESALRVAGLQYASLDADLMIGSALLGFAGYLALAVILRSGLKSPHSLCCIKSITNSSDQTKPFLETSHVCSVPSPAFLTRVTLLHVYGDTAMAACVLVSALVIRMQVGCAVVAKSSVEASGPRADHHGGRGCGGLHVACPARHVASAAGGLSSTRVYLSSPGNAGRSPGRPMCPVHPDLGSQLLCQRIQRSSDPRCWLRAPGPRCWLRAPGPRCWLRAPGPRCWLRAPGPRCWLRAPGPRCWLRAPGPREWCRCYNSGSQCSSALCRCNGQANRCSVPHSSENEASFSGTTVMEVGLHPAMKLLCLFTTLQL
ncbi:Cation efflux protein [Trinorchestia longiramus]|nr:Cation efflux protein [Trinorchestia longiramus]